MRYIKTFESYSKDDFYIEVSNELESYNITPSVINKILDECQNDIDSYMNNGKTPKDYVNKIVKDMELDSGGFLPYKTVTSQNNIIKYL